MPSSSRSHRIGTIGATLSLLLSALVFAACKGSTAPESAPPWYAGEWHAVLANDAPLPYVAGSLRIDSLQLTTFSYSDRTAAIKTVEYSTILDNPSERGRSHFIDMRVYGGDSLRVDDEFNKKEFGPINLVFIRKGDTLVSRPYWGGVFKLIRID